MANKEQSSFSINNLITTILLVVVAFVAGMFWTRSGMGPNSVAKPDGSAGVQEVPGGNNPSAPSQANVIDSLVSAAVEAGADENEFRNCVDTDEMADTVASQEATGKASGVTGTPGNILYNDELGEGLLIPGAYPIEMVQEFTEYLVAGDVEGLDTAVTDLKAENPGISITRLGRDDVTPVGDDDYVRGSRDAKVALIEYSDYDCPFCGRFHATAKQLVEDNEGDVLWTYRQLPLDMLHPNARTKSEAALCVAKLAGEDAFWQFSDALLEN